MPLKFQKTLLLECRSIENKIFDWEFQTIEKNLWTVVTNEPRSANARWQKPRNCSEVDATPPIQISELGLVVNHGDDARVRLDQDWSFLDNVELFRLATPRTHAIDATDQEWDQVVDGVHHRFSLAEEEGMVRERYEGYRLTERIPSLSERHVAHLSEVNAYPRLVARSTNVTRQHWSERNICGYVDNNWTGNNNLSSRTQKLKLQTLSVA